MSKGAINLEAGCTPATVKPDSIVALDRHLDWNDLPRSYRLLNAVLHALHSTFADKEGIAAPMPIGRCGTAYAEVALDRSDAEVALLRQRVATGFKPDRLDNPEGAVLAVLDVLGETIDEAAWTHSRGVAAIRRCAVVKALNGEMERIMGEPVLTISPDKVCCVAFRRAGSTRRRFRPTPIL